MAKKPPGFFCYQESYEIIKNLSDEQAGKLLKAKYDYFMNLSNPVFDDPALSIIWNYEKARLVAGLKSYYIRCVKGKYANYVKYADCSTMDICSWVKWKKYDSPIDKEHPDPAFALVEPEDFLEKGKGEDGDFS